MKLSQFSGAQPRIEAERLPAGAAQKAVNCDLSSGSIRAMHASTIAAVKPGENVTYFIAHDGTFLDFPAFTTHAPGPVADSRLYITTDGVAPQLKVMPGGALQDLALPTPNAAPLISVETDPVEDPNDPLPVENVLYVTTWLTDLDEETPPSPASNILAVKEGATVRVSITDATPPVGTRINRLRVYRSQTSATGSTALYFVKELNAGTALYIHDLDTDPLQEALTSAAYDPPPADMQGITPLWAGIMAAYNGRDVYFSEPYKPHAWPTAYRLRTDYEIMGIVATGTIAVIVTTGTPYLVQGSHPDNFIMERLDVNLPCVSRQGVVDLGTGVAYPSHDGLVLVSRMIWKPGTFCSATARTLSAALQTLAT